MAISVCAGIGGSLVLTASKKVFSWGFKGNENILGQGWILISMMNLMFFCNFYIYRWQFRKLSWIFISSFSNWNSRPSWNRSIFGFFHFSKYLITLFSFIFRNSIQTEHKQLLKQKMAIYLFGGKRLDINHLQFLIHSWFIFLSFKNPNPSQLQTAKLIKDGFVSSAMYLSFS
jgi:hypothetical protein